ncbi:hypothetical protein MTO96_009879 [Rhipicephalus appendiculatus]
MFAPSAPLHVREAFPQRPRRETAAFTCAEPREISGSELAIALDTVCAAREPQAPPQVAVATRSAAIGARWHAFPQNRHDPALDGGSFRGDR